MSNEFWLSFQGRVNYERTPESFGRDFRGQVRRHLAKSVEFLIRLAPIRPVNWLNGSSDQNRIYKIALISAICLFTFVRWQLSSENLYPLFDMSLLKERSVLSAMLLGIFTGMILSGSLFVLPQFLRLVD
jgi:hypothetical protein